MKKQCVFIFLLNFCFHLQTMEKPNPAGIGSSRARNSLEELERNTLNAIELSVNLEPFSERFCEQVISTAPIEVQKIIRGLMDSAVRKKIDPEFAKLIFYGPSGGGKSTLSQVVAQVMGIPFIIVNSALLANEYKDSVSAGLTRVRILAKRAKATIIMDELDCITKQPDKKNSSYEENRLKALGQVLDTCQKHRLFFIGNLNDKKNMPDTLQTRLAGCIFEIPLLHDLLQRKSFIRFCLETRKIDSEKSLDFLAKKTAGLSNREIKRILGMAHFKALLVDSNTPLITLKDLQDARNKLVADKKLLAEKERDYEKIFNYTIQTLGTICNLANLGCTIFSTYNNYHFSQRGIAHQVESVRLQCQGLEKQDKSLEFQGTALGLQTRSVDLQEKSVEKQDVGLALQKSAFNLQLQAAVTQDKALSLQNESLQQQKKGADLQVKSLENQEKSFIVQEKGLKNQDNSLSYQIVGNPITTGFWGLCKMGNGVKWVYNKTLSKTLSSWFPAL